ncbi:hypothetical protein C8R47DRAFT_582819 [Mycena vitilis]|nr:hypothetical protein C8R47DRAFT_582819 [Mycena vitilis]
MHRSLSVCEVVRIICQHFLESSALGSLAALGTVCRAFSDPAFDVLWSEQTSLEPIVGCIQAPDLWKQKNVSLSRPVRSSDLTRFSYYSRRVKIYRQRKIANGIDPFLTSGLFSTLQTIAPQSLCFPNIHTFEWSGVGKSYEWLPLFLGPLVTSITLHLGSGPCHPWLPLSILPRLTSQYPSMKQATITFDNPEPQQHGPTRIRSVSDAVTGWNHLHSLTVDGLDGSGWLHLPTLSRLKVLHVGKIDEEVIPLLRDNAKDHGRGFATLRELRVGTSRLEACVQLARYFSRSPLHTFIVGISHRAPASWWKQLFAIISHGCMSTTLEIIRIHRAANYRSRQPARPGTDEYRSDRPVVFLPQPVASRTVAELPLFLRH